MCYYRYCIYPLIGVFAALPLFWREDLLCSDRNLFIAIFDSTTFCQIQGTVIAMTKFVTQKLSQPNSHCRVCIGCCDCDIHRVLVSVRTSPVHEDCGSTKIMDH